MQTHNEIWKDIPNYAGLYQVSNLGRVKSLDRFNAAGQRIKGSILKGGITNGYNRVSLNGEDGARKHFMVHRLVMIAFFGGSSLEVNHKNGDKLDNRLENLEYCTGKENMNHAVKTGLVKVGEEASASKLTENEAREIKYRNKNLTQREIATKYGVSHMLVSLIRSGKKWKHI